MWCPRLVTPGRPVTRRLRWADAPGGRPRDRPDAAHRRCTRHQPSELSHDGDAAFLTDVVRSAMENTYNSREPPCVPAPSRIRRRDQIRYVQGECIFGVGFPLRIFMRPASTKYCSFIDLQISHDAVTQSPCLEKVLLLQGNKKLCM